MSNTLADISFNTTPDDISLLMNASSPTKFKTFWDATIYITLADRCKY
jgi:hypothetical protein